MTDPRHPPPIERPDPAVSPPQPGREADRQARRGSGTPVVTVPITVIIPTHNRVARTCETIDRIMRCSPAPDEILVHVDAGDRETAAAVAARFPEVRLLAAETRQGPGGGRNRLVAAARHEILASFDDDSWPRDAEFFASAWRLFETHPECALIACRIREQGDPDGDLPEEQRAEPEDAGEVRAVGSFVGCGCVFRRSAFLATSGYLPIPLAYGAEESDVALQLLDRGHQLGASEELRVQHDCDRETHHRSSAINAAQIRNTALLAFLRFPVRFWPLALGQVLNRVLYSIRKGRLRGIASGLASIPGACWQYRAFRDPLSPAAFRRWTSLRKGG